MTDELDAALSTVHGGAGPAPERDALDDALEQVHGESRMRLAASRLQTQGANPDQAAEGLRLGREQGVPPAVALENVDQLRADSEAARLERLHAESPVLARWLTTPENLAVAKDDVENLSALGKVWRPVAAAGRELAAGLVDVSGLYKAASSPFEMLAEAGRLPDGSTMAPGALMFGRFLSQTGDLAKGAPKLVEPTDAPQGPIEAGVRAGFRSAGQTVLPLAASVATGQPQIVLGALTAQTTGAEYDRARETLAPSKAFSYAAVQGGFEYITERAPALKLFGDLKAGSPFYKTLLNNLIREIPGEQAATLLQDFNSWVTLNPEKPLAEFVAERPDAAAQTLVATLVATGLQTGSAHAVSRIMDRFDRAQGGGDGGKTLEQVDTLADASKLRERSPEKFEEVAQQSLAAAGRETVYMPVEQFETFFQSAKIDPAAAWQRLTGDPSGYATARATGADLQIPYAKYLARLTPEERKALTPHLRMSPEAMTAAEAEAFGKDGDRILGGTLTPAEAQADPAYDFIYNDLLGQLLQRFPRDVAEKYAAAEAARFVAFNKANDTDALEDYKANAPRILSEVPDELRRQQFDVALDPLLERLRTGNVPTEREVRGPSLLEFLRSKGGVQDQGGELSTMDAEKADRAIRTSGQRRLVNPEGLTLDEAREAAVEAGYLTEAESDQEATSDISQLLSAIDKELRGTAVYAQGRESGDADTRRQLNALGDFLAQSGVDLNTVSNEDVKKFLQSGVAPQAMQQQDQTVLEQLPAERVFVQLGTQRVEVSDIKDAQAKFDEFRQRLMEEGFGSSDAPTVQIVKEDGSPVGYFSWNGRVWKGAPGGAGTELTALHQSAIPAWPALSAVIEQSGGDVGALRANVETLIDDGRAPQYLTEETTDEGFAAAVREAAAETKRGGDGGNQINTRQFLNDLLGLEATETLFQAAADGSAGVAARGQIRFTKGPGNRQFEITLKDADLSTFLHEMGHYWLERMADAAERPDAPQQIRDDYAAVLKWLGVESRDQIGTEQHEMFARANEAYLMEGKAPSVKLRAVFARFRNWLLQVYERLSRLNVSLSPEVRGVFDRLYATQEEIAQARNAMFLKPLWLDRESAGMSEADWKTYVASFDAARAQAEEELAAEVMEPIRREEKDWWKAKRKAVTEEVTAQVNRRKDFVALSVLRTGKTPDGAEVDTPKLSKDALVKDFGFTPESLAKLPRGIYTAGEGASADDLAPMFGYASGKELIEALAVVPNKQALIKELAEAELKRLYPDIIDDGSIGDRAMRAVHSDKAGELLVREAQILADKAKVEGKTAGLRRYQLSRQMAKAAAAQVIDGTPLKDIQPAKWRAAEAKAGNEAYRLAREGKLAEAAAAKQKQVLNHFLYREAVDALEAAEKRVKDMRSLSTKEAREAIGKAGGNEYVATYRDGTQEVFDSRKQAEEAVAEKPGFWFATNTYLEQIDRLLERYELRVQTNRKLESRESLRAFVDKLDADGIPHGIPADVVADARQVNYRELPYGFLTAVADAVDSIEHVALRKSQLIIAGQKRDRDEAAEVIAGGIKGNIKDRLPSIGEPDFPEKALDYGNDALSIYLNADYMTREMDGGQAGAVTDVVYRPVAEAEVHVVNRKAQADKDLAELFGAHYSAKELRAMKSRRGANAIPMPEIGETWSKFNVLKLAMDWGNEGNREAVLRGEYAGGRRITQATVDRLLGLNGQQGLMTENDWKFVQGLAKYIDGFWPEIRAKQEARTGVAPAKVQGAPFLTRFGQMPGWYSPLKYDPRQGGLAAQEEKEDLFQDLLNGRHGSAQTARGHTIARKGSGGRPVKMDFDVLFTHINNVITDLELGDAVSGVYRLLQHKGVERAFTDAGKSAYLGQLKLWLKDVARGQGVAMSAVSRPARALRINFTKSVLTFKVATALLQQTGHVQSMVVIGPKAWAKGVGQLLSRPWVGKNSVFNQIADISPFMKARWDSATANAGVYDAMRRAGGDLRPNWMVQAGYWAMLHSQMLVDAPTWMGAYNKAISKKADAKAAVRAADDAVKHAQGSGMFADRSALERGTLTESERQSEFVKMFTTLLSYMMAKGRLAYETTRNADFKDPVKVSQWTLTMLMVFTVETLLAGLVRGQLPGDEDDDDSRVDDIALWLAKQTGLTALSVVPFINMIGSELQGFRGGIPLTDAMKRFANTARQAKQGEMDKAAVRAITDTVGILTGLPSGQANVALDAFWREQEGEDVSPIEYLMRVSKDE